MVRPQAGTMCRFNSLTGTTLNGGGVGDFVMLAPYVLCGVQGALAWNGDMLSSGSRDRLILQRDVRTPAAVERRLIGHRQEVRF